MVLQTVTTPWAAQAGRRRVESSLTPPKNRRMWEVWLRSDDWGAGRMKKTPTFYAQQTAQSRIKAEMITKYFASRAKIISGAGATKMVYVDLYTGRGRYDDGAESTPLMVLRRAHRDPVVRTSLATIFNDRDNAEALGAEIRALPRIVRPSRHTRSGPGLSTGIICSSCL
jgi:hypothetical protein